jgi:hypothetical protein
MWISFRLGRPVYFAEGVLAAYVGLVRLAWAPFDDPIRDAPLLLAALLGAGALVLVFAAHQRMSGR